METRAWKNLPFYQSVGEAVPGDDLGRAGIVAMLASDDGAYITGQAISVSGGMNMV